jgi:hypothetical protein
MQGEGEYDTSLDGYANFQNAITQPMAQVHCVAASGVAQFQFAQLKTEIGFYLARWTTRAEEDLYLFGTAAMVTAPTTPENL